MTRLTNSLRSIVRSLSALSGLEGLALFLDTNISNAPQYAAYMGMLLSRETAGITSARPEVLHRPLGRTGFRLGPEARAR